MRTGSIAALTFGQAVTGVSLSMLRKQHGALAASVVATPGGGDLVLTLMLADGGPRGCADTAFAAHADPIAHLAMAVWASWLPHTALQRAERRLAGARRIWTAVRGHTAALVATAGRLAGQLLTPSALQWHR